MTRATLAIALAAAWFLAGCGAQDADHRGAGAGNEPRPVSAEELLSREPYMGVSCGIANEFACDRVGLAVWLREPAAEVDAAIAGRRFELDDPDWSGAAVDGERRMFAGFLQPAGLIDGPLQVTPDDGPDRWIGHELVSATVRIWVGPDNGTGATTTLEVELSPGWG